MCGSGTVLRNGVEAGLHCNGVDIDPLSVLMSKVWVTPIEALRLVDVARHLVEEATSLPLGRVDPIQDDETSEFISFWFAKPQRLQLERLSTTMRDYQGPERDALAVSLSRIIVTKEQMASLARDTSHSRPHRVTQQNDFDVYTGFLKAVKHVSARLAPELIRGTAEVSLGDARNLDNFNDESFDIAITSPPYLNAIDYLRGHKLALVWLGYELSQIRKTRSSSVGAEKKYDDIDQLIDVSRYVAKGHGARITDRHIGWVKRYAVDMSAILKELARVVKENGRIVMVVGNSFLRGAHVNNAMLVEDIAGSAGLICENSQVRSIPARRRYLPPPGDGSNTLDTRMRTETVIKFVV